LISFFIPGQPKALKRHRTFRRGAVNINIDPSAGDKADFLLQAMQHRPSVPFRCPLVVRLTFFFARPKSHYNKKGLKTGIPIWQISRPDADNCIKQILDSLNKVFWVDDSIICDLRAMKVYSEAPGIAVQISPIDGENDLFADEFYGAGT
jgi:Holliday junction resolvase RusA-like endonuclease